MVADDASSFSCTKCGNQRYVDHPRLGRIRCTSCTTVDLPRDPRVWRHLKAHDELFRLNAAEERRVRRAMERIIALTLKADALKLARLDRDLISTDRIMLRWGDFGSGMPASNPDVYRMSRLPPLDEQTQLKVNDIVRASPQGIAIFCDDYYASNIPVDVLRGGPYYSKRGEPRPGRYLSERGWYREKASVLRYLRHKFERSGHSDLVALVRALP